MKKIALGILAAATLFTAVPAMAQVGFYAGPGGVGIGVGAPGPYYGDCGYYGCRRYYDGPVVTFGTEPRYWHHYRHWD
jgi:hypothetical protein